MDGGDHRADQWLAHQLGRWPVQPDQHNRTWRRQPQPRRRGEHLGQRHHQRLGHFDRGHHGHGDWRRDRHSDHHRGRGQRQHLRHGDGAGAHHHLHRHLCVVQRGSGGHIK